MQVYRVLDRLRFFEPELDDDLGELGHHMRASPIRYVQVYLVLGPLCFFEPALDDLGDLEHQRLNYRRGTGCVLLCVATCV